MSTITPVQLHERETFMDVLRGFAVLGIFIANLGSGFSFYNENAHATGPYIVEGWDHRMQFLHHMLIEGKFYSIFSLLFGWGIALQVKRGMAKGVSAIPTIRRRLLFMLVLGFVHLMIWPGDIVFFYALLGFLLIPLQKFSNKTLLVTGGVLILSPILLYWLKMEFNVLNYPAKKLFEIGQWVDNKLHPEWKNFQSQEQYLEAIKKSSVVDLVKGNMAGFFYRYGYLFFVSRISKVLGMFLIGYVIGRTDFYKNLVQNKKIIYWVIGVGLVAGLVANYFLAENMSTYMGQYFNLQKEGLYQTIYYALGVAPLALAYVGLFMLSFKTGPGRKILSVLAPAGKMAFTNYIMQSLIGHFFFLGLGYAGKVGPVYFTLFGILVFIGQIIFSTIWLKFFNYGPLEWLWRSATYGKWQAMIKKTTN